MMTRISSQMTRFYKYVLPVLWFGFLAVFLAIPIASGAIAKAPFLFLPPLVMAIFGFFIFKRLIWNLADLVRDGGDFLMVNYRGYEERIPLTNIMNVSATTNRNPPRITLRLVSPGPFGSELSFSPIKPFSFNPFAKNPIAEDLIVRVHNAQTRHAP